MARLPRSDEDFSDEIEAHLALEADRLVTDGMSPEEARAAARRAFGSPGRSRVQFYESRRTMWVDHARREVRAAIRTLVHHRGASALTVVMLALGFGANIAMFSVMRAVLFQPPPFADADRLAMIWQTDRATGTTREPASIPDYADIAARATTLSTVAAFAGSDANVTIDSGGDPFRVATLSVSAAMLPMLGSDPLVGRAFRADEDRPAGRRVVIIGERLWHDRFGRDPAVTRRTLRIDDVPYEIVGVMPRTADYGVLQILSAAAYGRAFADRGRVSVDAWLPLRADAGTASRDNHPIFVMGRLKHGSTVAAAGAELTRIAADLERTYPSSNDGRGIFVELLNDVVLGPVRPALYALMGAVALVLLVACVNAASLLLVQASGRAREVAVRAALGAGRWRLLGQFLAEGLVLSALAVAAGVALAWWALRVVVSFAPATLPRASTIAIDVPALLVATAAGALVAVGAALVPAFHVRDLNVLTTLKAEGGRTASGGRGRRRVLGALAVAQVALAMVLVIGAGLLMRSFLELSGVAPGFRADGVLKVEYELPENRYPRRFPEFPRWAEVGAFNDTLLRRVAALPGVDAAAVASDHPLAAGFTNSFTVVGRESESRNWPEISVRSVSADYARVTGLTLEAGRHLRQTDTAETPAVLLINDTARRLFFPTQDPLGQQIAFWGTPRTIVGVVADEKIHGLAQAAPPAAYAPVGQLPLADTLLVRTKGDPATIALQVRGVVRDIDPGLAIFGVEPLRQTVASSLAQERFTTTLLGLFAMLTLGLASLGVYGVLSHGVAQRHRELGLRLALGARPSAVVRLVMGEGLLLCGAGMAVGLAGALLLGSAIKVLLFGVGATDVATLTLAPVVIAASALLAAYVPARRAARLQPAAVLRPE
jgi:putative ABC transport system permease protein